jgi:xylulokinase
MGYLLGIDIGTSSTKAVGVDADGSILTTAHRQHEISRPRPGRAEHDPMVWWDEVASLSTELVRKLGGVPDAVCVSGMGPCLAPTDVGGSPLRPAILYGIDTRARAEIEELTEQIGEDIILARGGSLLSSQAVGPKLLWLRHEDPDVWSQTRRFFMPSSFSVWQLTGEYVLDHHSASQCNPLYDLTANTWNREMVELIAPTVEMPRLLWPGEVAGQVTKAAASATGLARGTPVLAGTVDAWAESVSVGAIGMGDMMLMYGSTMFMTQVVRPGSRSPLLWATAGVRQGTETLAAGMATGGIVASWFSELVGEEIDSLLSGAERVSAGADGLLLLPYFAGERTPIFDPLARGTVLGLTLSHGRQHLMRALLEGVALGVRHNLGAFTQVSGQATRYIAVGGGARSETWPQVVSDVSGITQIIPRHTVGAALGDAMLAAEAIGIGGCVAWNPVDRTVYPRPELAATYDELFNLYLRAYLDSRGVTHDLAERST